MMIDNNSNLSLIQLHKPNQKIQMFISFKIIQKSLEDSNLNKLIK